jgi:3-oxoacyl-[acyl-carrier-protein] synthase-1
MGQGKAETRATLFEGSPAHMVSRSEFLPGDPVTLGAIPGALPPVPKGMEDHDTRTIRMLWAALQQIRPEVDAAISRHGADRIGVVLGTSTSGIDEGMRAYGNFLETGALTAGYAYHRQEIGDPGVFLRAALGLTGPMLVISTACSSSAKALSSAARLLAADLCDAVLVGGVDSLCQLTVAGFNALGLVAPSLCQPMSANRAGITIGEGAALFLMTRKQDGPNPVALLGVGETSDAHHPSAPHPEGRGAIAAMEQALVRADLGPKDIAYLNLHGTATPLNDAMEAKAVAAVLGTDTPVSSTKPLTGHALGAAGALEAAILWLSLAETVEGAPLPRHLWDGARDPALPPLALVEQANHRLPATDRLAMMSNSFAFGGSNVSVILGRGWENGEDAT